MIAGIAGSGKSYLINCLVNAVRRFCNGHNAIRVLCPTGFAASLISGASTIHRILKVPIGKDSVGELKAPTGEKDPLFGLSSRKLSSLKSQ